METSEQSQTFYLKFSPELNTAIDAVVLYNAQDGKINLRSRSNFICDVLKKFVIVAPYDRDGFFWTKRVVMYKDPKASAKYGLGHDEDYAPLGKLLERHELLDHQKIIMDHGEVSLGKNLTKTIVGHTAIVWWITTQLTEAEKVLPEVDAFMDYAKHHYVDRKTGEILINRYQRDFDQYLESQSAIQAKESAEKLQNDMLEYSLFAKSNENHTNDAESFVKDIHLDFYDLSTQDMGDDMRVSFNIKKSDLMDWVKRFMVFAQASDLHDFVD